MADSCLTGGAGTFLIFDHSNTTTPDQWSAGLFLNNSGTKAFATSVISRVPFSTRIVSAESGAALSLESSLVLPVNSCGNINHHKPFSTNYFDSVFDPTTSNCSQLLFTSSSLIITKNLTKESISSVTSVFGPKGRRKHSAPTIINNVSSLTSAYIRAYNILFSDSPLLVLNDFPVVNLSGVNMAFVGDSRIAFSNSFSVSAANYTVLGDIASALPTDQFSSVSVTSGGELAVSSINAGSINLVSATEITVLSHSTLQAESGHEFYQCLPPVELTCTAGKARAKLDNNLGLDLFTNNSIAIVAPRGIIIGNSSFIQGSVIGVCSSDIRIGHDTHFSAGGLGCGCGLGPGAGYFDQGGVGGR